MSEANFSIPITRSTPSLLLSETGHAQVACSVVNALTTALFRYHPVLVEENCKYDFV